MADGTHCDLMFELDGRLITWRLTDLDELMAGGPIDAVRTADHRIGYLDYEGSVPGDRGAVRVLARGFLQAPGWSEDGMRAELIGDLAGVLTARRTGGPAWRLVLLRSRWGVGHPCSCPTWCDRSGSCTD